MHINSSDALEKLKNTDSEFLNLFQHGSLKVEVYRPDGIDRQTPHEFDEVYVIISGNGEFLNGKDQVLFSAGDFLFVPAGVDHRFINFTEDFSTWVFFYGPKGGESSK